ncbi:exosortase A [Methylococcus sp. EFPC2]|uniref:exosortase A n=1 Tax=Methylococcus sp. EFPC2 TaxID=2812648 RepID=UPI001967D31D|nr:exosortase A [Methylococcus sp. EFPC2]QSA98016.1 exosortase A [Methylococcus sp. EFPC2]
MTVIRNAQLAWRHTAAISGVGLVLLLLVYRSTLMSMITIWERSETFAHGFLIFPITAYLIWRRRSALVRLTPQPDARGLLLLVGFGLIWLLARLAGVLVVEQASLVGMIASWVCTVSGFVIAREIAFPLGFLLFGVPFGEFLIPPMMNFTADFTVGMLQLTGIPVYREGTFFSIPSGDWSVVEGCSGLRYLIASITLGFLYAYLSYHSLLRRLAFIALACVFPVIANGLRAYMIVMIAHLSDMKLALGVDHYIYGWVFFGLVMLLLFWLGSLWSEPEEVLGTDSVGVHRAAPFRGVDRLNTGIIALAALSFSVVWPLRADYLDALSLSSPAVVRLSAPAPAGPWQPASSRLTGWEPRYVNPDAKLAATYSDGQHAVAVYVLYYRRQNQDHELINSQNVLVPQKHPEWRMPEERPVSVRLSGRDLKVLQGRVQSAGQNLLVWRWNRVAGGHNTVNEYWAKALEAGKKLAGNIEDAAGIVIATDYEDDTRPAADVLQRFVDDMWPSIEQSLVRAGAE